jgi:hypothetical protein
MSDTETPQDKTTRPGTKDDLKELMSKSALPTAEDLQRAFGPGEHETGVPSPQLERLRDAVEKSKADGSGIIQVDNAPEYETLTTAQAEAGVYSLVGGYIDRDGVLHKEVEIEAMGGDEEDLLGNRNIPIVLRLNAILSRVVKRLGSITDRGMIARAVSEMPLGTRQHLLIAMRVTSHWLSEKDLYRFTARCPRCRQESEHAINLLSLEHYEPEDPSKQLYELELPYSKEKVQWRVLPGEWDHALDVLARNKEMASDFLTHAIIARVISVNGEKVDLSVTDVLTPDKRKAKISKRAQQVIKWAKRAKVVDRDRLRAHFLENEPGVDTDIECECKSERCGATWSVPLDLGQEGFFFPQATSMRSKTRSSI